MTIPNNNGTSSSAASEERFRQIFFTHLQDDGFTDAQAYRLIFKTPEKFHGVPSADHGSDLLKAFREAYRHQLPYSWFFDGLSRRPESDGSLLEAPEKPVTLVVVPGIFGEFIEQLPFQEVVDRRDSHFSKKWQGALEKEPDQVFSLLELDDVPCKMSDTIKIGSIDQGNRSFANIIVLKAQSGSLETLGPLASNVSVFQRRLAKVFEIINDDTEIYLLGYSRGLAVALDLVSSLHDQSEKGELPSESESWFKRIRGVVGLGGVYYGANFAQQVLNGESGATSDLVKFLVKAAGQLKAVPEGSLLAEKAEIVAGNSRIWADFAKNVNEVKGPKAAAGKIFLDMDLEEIFAKEGKARILGRDVPVPSPLGIFSMVKNFFLQTFRLKNLVTRYNENIHAMKVLVAAVVAAVETLTPESRDQWWLSHKLPQDLVLFSITGSMPDAHLNDFASPMWHFSGFGTRTSDYNVSLRASYYDTLASENTQVNDSQVSHFCSRYWEQMYPDHQYAHHYLGVLGTHHWGMAFPYSIKDDPKIGSNPFPRTTLLKSLASFILSLDRHDAKGTEKDSA